MKVVLSTAAIVALCACNPTSFGKLERTIRIFCGIADVVISETDFAKAKKAFGEDSIGSKVCELFLPGGQDSDTPLTLPTTLVAPLPLTSEGEDLGSIIGTLQIPK